MNAKAKLLALFGAVVSPMSVPIVCSGLRGTECSSEANAFMRKLKALKADTCLCMVSCAMSSLHAWMHA